MQSKDEYVLTEPTGPDAALLPMYTTPARATGALASYRAADIVGAAGAAITSWPEHSGGTAFGASTGATVRTAPGRYLELGITADMNRATPAGGINRFFIFQVPSLPAAGQTRAIMGSSVSAGSDRQEFGIDTTGHWYLSNGTVLSTPFLADTNWHVGFVSDAGAGSVLRIDDLPAVVGASGSTAAGTNFKLANDGTYSGQVHWAANFAEIDFYGSLSQTAIDATIEALLIDAEVLTG